MKIQEPTILLISVHAEYADKIFTEQKTVELRKIRPKRLKKGDLVIVYVTSPDQNLQGIFEVEKIIENSPKKLWLSVKDKAGIKKKDFDTYYQATSLGIAIYIKKVVSFPRPINLKEIQETWSNFRPPQSYKYVTTHEFNLIKNMIEINIFDAINLPKSKQITLNS